jgi:gp6-like head-tail connector protein
MATFVTLDEAKAHLHEGWTTGDPRDADLQMKLDAAEETILEYLDDVDLVTPWTPTTVPQRVKNGILLVVGELWRYRGDDAEAPARDESVGNTDFHPAVVSLLRRLRHHAL